MGIAGQKPTPTGIKNVLGNPGGRPYNTEEIEPEGEVVKPNALELSAEERFFLNSTAQLEQKTEPYTAAELVSMKKRAALLHREEMSRIWDQYAPELIRLGTVTVIDVDLFRMWCSLAAEMRRHEANGTEMPAARIAQWRYLGTTFGMDASERARLLLKPHGKAKTKDKAEKYFDIG